MLAGDICPYASPLLYSGRTTPWCTYTLTGGTWRRYSRSKCTCKHGALFAAKKELVGIREIRGKKNAAMHLRQVVRGTSACLTGVPQGKDWDSQLQLTTQTPGQMHMQGIRCLMAGQSKCCEIDRCAASNKGHGSPKTAFKSSMHILL